MSALDPALAPLVGSWRLLSVEAVFSDHGERMQPWGQDPDGRMMLADTGRIMFLFTRHDRRPPATQAERARMFDELLCYSGMVRADGPGRFITTVDIAKNPAAIGQDLVRLFTLDGDRLVVSVPEGVSPMSQGRAATFGNVFVRERPAG